MTTEQIDPLCETMTLDDAELIRTTMIQEATADGVFAQAATLRRALATYHALSRVTAENARLQREWDVAHKANEELCAEHAKHMALRVENARLRDALERIVGMCDVPSRCACGRPNGIGAVVACAKSTLTGGRDNG